MIRCLAPAGVYGWSARSTPCVPPSCDVNRSVRSDKPAGRHTPPWSGGAPCEPAGRAARPSGTSRTRELNWSGMGALMPPREDRRPICRRPAQRYTLAWIHSTWVGNGRLSTLSPRPAGGIVCAERRHMRPARSLAILNLLRFRAYGTIGQPQRGRVQSTNLAPVTPNDSQRRPRRSQRNQGDPAGYAAPSVSIRPPAVTRRHARSRRWAPDRGTGPLRARRAMGVALLYSARSIGYNAHHSGVPGPPAGPAPRRPPAHWRDPSCLPNADAAFP